MVEQRMQMVVGTRSVGQSGPLIFQLVCNVVTVAL